MILPRTVSDQQRRELGAFARYCAQRIERDVGVQDQWRISLIMAEDETFTSVASVQHHGERIATEGCGVGTDPALTIWNAMCRLEHAIVAVLPSMRYRKMFA